MFRFSSLFRTNIALPRGEKGCPFESKIVSLQKGMGQRDECLSNASFPYIY
nr:MAG TPA: hypothetical protein [Caudoviricetes sp.]